MNREALLALANEAARDPSRAARIAGWIADELRDVAKAGETATPAGYLYAPAHKWIAQVRDLAPEFLPTPASSAIPTFSFPGPTKSNAEYTPIRVPFDALIVGVYGWGQLIAQPIDGVVPGELLAVANALPGAIDGRDMFGISISIDGQASFGTDGRNQLLLPASVVVGTLDKPRPTAWTLRRNQIIGVQFRNLVNVPFNVDDFLDPGEGDFFHLRAGVGFLALNLERP